ncbi:actin cross-linking [Moniliophthora roreri]|nr:actin cross-linking [Moniliophthora roreri]
MALRQFLLARLNTKLEANGYPPMTSLVKDLSDGVRLIQLMVRHLPGPIQQITPDANPEGRKYIIDGNLKLILGMIWTLILRFTIADISEEGLSAKEGLLLWCQRKTEPYKEVDVQDFSSSWSDGLALCALIHCHRPDLLDYDKLNKLDRHGNTRLAFQIAAEHLNIPQLLEVEDLCDSKHPDERSVMTYIACYFHAFSSMGSSTKPTVSTCAHVSPDQAETVSRRVEKFAELMQSVWVSRNDYERRIRLLLAALSDIQAKWLASTFTGSYIEAKAQSADFTIYKQTTKRTWVTEKQDVATLFGNVQTKLKTYGLREIKETLRKKFADLANDFEHRLHLVSSELTAIDGPLEVQQQLVQQIQTRIHALSDILGEVASAEAECSAANVEENDYTVFTCQDLEFELELLVQSIAKKIAFIDNQIVSRNMTNLTPAQLEQFESTFRYFHRDESNTLNQSEMTAALASLGIVYSDEDMDYIYDQLVQDYGAVSFEAFINLLVDIMEDQTTPDQLRESFRGIASDKSFVTELDLRIAHLPASAIDYLREAMPSTLNEAGEPQYDYERWLDEVFVQS